MDFDLVPKPKDEKKMVWGFTINYNEARAYRGEKEGMLRPNQWADLTVKVYVYSSGREQEKLLCKRIVSSV